MAGCRSASSLAEDAAQASPILNHQLFRSLLERSVSTLRAPQPPRLLLPDAPALVAGAGRATLLTPDGEVLTPPLGAALAQELAKLPPPLLVHAPATARRLDLPAFLDAFDLLELFAFCLPGRLAAPTPRGLAVALDLPVPADDADAAALQIGRAHV